MASIILCSLVTCPHCGHQAEEEMSQESSLWYYKCKACERSLTPRRGECCIFCAYGNIACPSIQQAVNDMSGLGF